MPKNKRLSGPKRLLVTVPKAEGIAVPTHGKIHVNSGLAFDKELAEKRVVDVPPDPEEMNETRSDSAQAALHTFVLSTGTEIGDSLCDLLCDIMHFADRHGFTFDHELDRARDHYSQETDPDEVTEDDEESDVLQVEGLCSECGHPSKDGDETHYPGCSKITKGDK